MKLPGEMSRPVEPYYANTAPGWHVAETDLNFFNSEIRLIFLKLWAL